MTRTTETMQINRRRFLETSAVTIGTVLGANSLLAACGSSPASSASSSTSTQPVTLKIFTWILPDNAPTIAEIDKRFQALHPNVTTKWTNIPTDQYETVLRTRLAAGDVPDLFTVFPGTKAYPYVQSGSLLDISHEPWAANLSAGARRVATYHDKLFGMPIGESVIGVTYNKQIFSKLGLSIPKTWSDFVQVSQKIKDSGTIPLALGIKDQWVDQLIPYAMAPSAIYSPNPRFDEQMFAGQRTFASSTWSAMMQDYLDLNKKGFFNSGALGTTYNQTVDLMASGKTAMVVNGSWIVPPIQKANPKIELGMFPLPYVQANQPIWVSASVGTVMSIASKSKHIDTARQYLNFWARPEIMNLFLDAGGSYSTFTNITAHIKGPAADMTPYLKVGTYNFLDQQWPVGVQDAMLQDIQGVFAGSKNVNQMLQDMDSAFNTNKAKAS